MKMKPDKQSKLSAGRTHFIEHSALFLPNCSQFSRKPRFGWKRRPAEFFANFEQKILFYDVFWHADGKKILLIGPPPHNLLAQLKKAKFSVDREKTPLSSKFHISQSVMITELNGDTTSADILHIEFENLTFELKIQPNYSKLLANSKIIFTINKDNPLKWINAWADYYHHFHEADSLILLDNGSSNASLNEIASQLEKTGIENIFILSMPYIFGAIDDAVITHHFWTNFLQISLNSLVLRRFAAKAQGLLNCDIDELAVYKKTGTIFDALNNTPHGLLAMNGYWVEPYPYKSNFGDHRDFGYKLSDPKLQICKAKKWIIDPKKDWVQKLNIHPYWHWIVNRPQKVKSMSDDAFFWHFKGINSNWKDNRNIVDKNLPNNIELDQEMINLFSSWPR